MQAVTLGFYEDGPEWSSIAGMPVQVVAWPSGAKFVLQTDKAGQITFATDPADSSLAVDISSWGGYCGNQHEMKIGAADLVMPHYLGRCK